MKTLHVALGERSYDIIIEKGILKDCGTQIASVCKAERALIVTDDTVGALYAETVKQALLLQGYQVKVVSFAPGEGSKSLESAQKLYDEAFDFGMTRSDVAVALGGGVIGDLTGFFAATLYRGIPFIQIPTTLLAQVDSSVGGKTGVNVPAGKNLVGSFYQPKRVLIDPETLDSLPDKDFADGMAEVIKYGCICSADLFSHLAEKGSRSALSDSLEDVIYTCCDAKRKLVEEDEHDTGSRMLLNFGHTLGHVIEKAFDFKTYTHGQAVSIGMVLAAKLCSQKGLIGTEQTQNIVSILKQYNLPTEVQLAEGWEKTLLLDKKMQSGGIHFVLIDAIGHAFSEKMNPADLVEQVKSFL